MGFTFWDWIVIGAVWSLVPIGLYLKYRLDLKLKKWSIEDSVDETASRELP